MRHKFSILFIALVVAAFAFLPTPLGKLTATPTYACAWVQYNSGDPNYPGYYNANYGLATTTNGFDVRVNIDITGWDDNCGHRIYRFSIWGGSSSPDPNMRLMDWQIHMRVWQCGVLMYSATAPLDSGAVYTPLIPVGPNRSGGRCGYQADTYSWDPPTQRGHSWGSNFNWSPIYVNPYTCLPGPC